MRLRTTLAVTCFLLLLPVAAIASAPRDCARVKAEPDVWVLRSVDALVRAAFAAYEDEDAVPAYQRVLGRITNTLERCGDWKTHWSKTIQ